MAARSSLLPAAHVVGLDHVQLAMPEGGEPLAREFYGGLLGLTEVDKPIPLSGVAGAGSPVPAGCTSTSASRRSSARIAKAHPALLVADLATLRARLGAAWRRDRDR